MAQKIQLLVFSLFIICYEGIAQHFLNLDFEYGVYRSQPRQWSIEGEGEMYDGFLDSSVSISGKRSLHLKVRNGEIYTFFSLPGKLVAGSTIQIEGFIKFRSSDSLTTMLAFRNPNGEKPDISPAIKATGNDWIPLSYQAAFAKDYNSDRLLVALIGIGTGEFWFDDIHLKINGVDYGNSAPNFKEPTPKEIKWLNESAHPIRSFSSKENLSDLFALKKITGDVRIVALGENSHGSSSIFKIKLRMITLLVREKGFSIFALESPAEKAAVINDYVLFNKGTINDVIESLAYQSWQTQEMVDIIQWMKSYNDTSARKVAFKAFDRQGPLLKNIISRDEIMARQIDSLVKTNGGKKIIISADNTHVTKASGKMGSFLNKWYGSKYLAFGFTYNDGTYAAYGPEKNYEVYPSYIGTFEYFFSKCTFKNFYLDLRTIHSIPIFETTGGFRSIGSRPQLTTQFSEIVLKKHFDVIVYLEHSKHTIPFAK